MKKSIILALTAVIAVCAITVTGCFHSKNNKADTITIGNSIDADNVYEMPKTLSFSAPALLSAEESGYTASITLKATVLPVEAKNKEVDWTVSWNVAPTHGSEVVTNYVDVTPTEDGSTTATVNCYKAFDDDTITITVTTRIGGFTATCSVLYVGNPTSLDISATGASVVKDSGWNTDIAEVAVGNTYDFDLIPNNEFGVVGSKFTPNYTVSFTSNGSFVMNDGAVGMPTMNGTKTVNLDSWINNEITYQYGTFIMHNRYLSFSIVSNKLHITAENVVSGLVDLSDVSGRGWTGKRFGSYTDSNKMPYITITVTETKTGITNSVNVRTVSDVSSVNMSQLSVGF